MAIIKKNQIKCGAEIHEKEQYLRESCILSCRAGLFRHPCKKAACTLVQTAFLGDMDGMERTEKCYWKCSWMNWLLFWML